MFEVGFAELFLLGVIALLVVGPERLPGLARTVGVWVGKAQRMVGQVRTDIEREVRADELRKTVKEYSPTSALGDMCKEVEDFASDISQPVDGGAEKSAPESPRREPAADGAAGESSEAPDEESGEPRDSEGARDSDGDRTSPGPENDPPPSETMTGAEDPDPTPVERSERSADS